MIYGTHCIRVDIYACARCGSHFKTEREVEAHFTLVHVPAEERRLAKEAESKIKADANLSRRIYEALTDITSDALAVRAGVRDGLSCQWASIESAKRLLDEVYRSFEEPRRWPVAERYGTTVPSSSVQEGK